MEAAHRMTTPLQLLADLKAVMPGGLAQFAPGLVGPDDPRQSIQADRILDREMVAAILARFDTKDGKPDLRAVVSVWVSSYLMAVLPPLLAANILLDRVPQTGLGEVAFIPSPDLRIGALRVAREDAGLEGADVFSRFDSIVRAHLAPFIELAAGRGQVTQRVLWSNAGHVFEAFLGKIESAAAGRQGLADARALLAAPLWPRWGRNPLYHPVRYLEGQRIRRVCCLRILVPEWKVCAICPLKADSPARRRSVALRS